MKFRYTIFNWQYSMRGNSLPDAATTPIRRRLFRWMITSGNTVSDTTNDFYISPLLEICKNTRQPRGGDIRAEPGARLALLGPDHNYPTDDSIIELHFLLVNQLMVQKHVLSSGPAVCVWSHAQKDAHSLDWRRTGKILCEIRRKVTDGVIGLASSGLEGLNEHCLSTKT